MEVHQHSHSPRKKWIHYFFEFLMLFLAVFLGFLAENKREHVVEKKRAKELVVSLITDLQKDTTLISWLQNFRENVRQPRLDSFYALLQTPREKINRKTYYGLMFRLSVFFSFSQSTGTINQMKNAGYLRYFSDPALLNLISDYEFWLQDFKIDENLDYHAHYDKLIPLVKSTGENQYTYQLYTRQITPEGIGLRPFNSGELDALNAALIEAMWLNGIMKEQNMYLKNKAVEIINYLQEHY